jgi:hypothetical protein
MSIIYKTVYPRWVLDDIQEGNEVFVLDKSTHSVAVVNDMTVRAVLGLIEAAEKSTNGRYVFWYVETEENEND